MNRAFSKEVVKKENEKKISYQASKEIALEHHQQVGKCHTVCATTVNKSAACITIENESWPC